jgi:DNA invertase Pin-like site-specific DNA recombinase
VKRPLPRSLDDLRSLRAARWIRESTPGQFDRYGPGAQCDLQDGAMRRLGLADTGLEWSAAQSGSTVHASAAMRSMIDAARSGAFDILVVGYVARWQRNLRQTLNLLEEDLHPAGVAVYFCDEELLSSNQRHWDQLVDEAKAAESWLRKHRRRVKEGLANKLATKNDPGGHPPFGFRRNAAKLIEPDPSMQDTVARIFTLCADGATDREIAVQIEMSLFTVRGILTSPLYVGRLRNGAKANWGPIVAEDLWERAQAVRARRATNTGRPAAPKRPYALSMLRCASCGRRIRGDTGYYRHREPCVEFLAAKPDLPPQRGRNRADGSGYKREWYESAIGELLRWVSLRADTLAQVVASVVSRPPAPDRLRLARIERERDAALSAYRANRDARALEATMTRLDAEAAEALQARETPGISANRAVEWLSNLGDGWDALDAAPERRLLAEALFESVDADGFMSLRVRFTPSAIAHGLADVIPDRLVLGAFAGNGRGERSRPDTFQHPPIEILNPDRGSAILEGLTA